MPALLLALPLATFGCRTSHARDRGITWEADDQQEPASAEEGVLNPNVIDLVAQDPDKRGYLLVMVGTPEWQKSRNRLPLLQAKVNTYLSFIPDGQMKKTYPASAGKPVQFELDCQVPPDPQLTAFIRHLQRSLTPYHIPLSAWLLSPTGEEGRQLF